MPIRLPFNSLIVPARQIRARISPRRSPDMPRPRFSAPETLGRGLGGVAPWGGAARAVRAQGPQGRRLLPAARGCRAETLLVAACPAAQCEHLRTVAGGRQARARALECEPQSLLLWQQGCDLEPVGRVSRRLAALQAGAFRFATFKSKPKPRTPLARLDVALEGKLRSSTYAGFVGRQQHRPLAHRAAPEHLDAAAIGGSSRSWPIA